jgi:hypothetical protein
MKMLERKARLVMNQDNPKGGAFNKGDPKESGSQSKVVRTSKRRAKDTMPINK